MEHTLTITVDDTVCEKLKPLIEQQTVGPFLAKIIGNDLPVANEPSSGIAALRGSLHQVDTSNIREETERAAMLDNRKTFQRYSRYSIFPQNS